MTLVAKKEQTPSAKLPTPIAATPPVTPTLPLPAPKTFVEATPKSESPALEVAKKSTTTQVPELVTGKLSDIPASVPAPLPAPQKRITAHEATHETPALALPGAPLAAPQPTRSIAKSDPTIVALPVSNVHPMLPRDLPKNLPNAHDLNRTAPQSDSFDPAESDLSPKPVDVVHRTVKSLDIGRPIARIDIADEAVCKAMPTESTSVILMGISKGSTIVTVWPEGGSQRDGRPNASK